MPLLPVKERSASRRGKTNMQNFLANIQKYINEHGFTIKFFDREPNFLYFLIEKGD